MQEWRGEGDLAGYRVRPTVQTRAAVLVLHAFAEHAGRHERTMRRLAARGIAAYAYDHRGHGRSPGRRGFVRDFDELTQDALLMLDSMASEESGHPLFLLGAGMGGVMAVHVALRRPNDFAGLVLVGPTFSPEPGTAAPRRIPLMASLVPALRGDTHDIRALSRNPVVVQEFRADPLTHRGGIPVQTGHELHRAAEIAVDEASALELPVLVVHGEDDKIAPVSGSRRFVEAANSDEITLYEVPAALHEPFNDPGGDTLIDEVGIWIRERARR
jgi:alpha-beta hydrolase superfamily lysophospholipase